MINLCLITIFYLNTKPCNYPWMIINGKRYILYKTLEADTWVLVVLPEDVEYVTTHLYEIRDRHTHMMTADHFQMHCSVQGTSLFLRRLYWVEEGNRCVVGRADPDFKDRVQSSMSHMFKLFEKVYIALTPLMPSHQDESMEDPCPICSEDLVNPKTTSCGHLYCGSCIDQWTHIKSQCPMCRTAL